MDYTLTIHQNEQQFIAALARGNREAQRLLYEEYYGTLMSICQRYAGSEDEAMDLLHESFIKIFKKISHYESGTALVAWMRRITVNTAIDQYRRNGRRRTEDLDKAYNVSTDAPDIFAQFGAREILAAVQQLPPTYRTIFNLYVVEGYSHREIGEQLQITESTSRSNLVKARGKLQKMLTSLGR